MKSSFFTALHIFKPLLQCSIFKCISWLHGSFFGRKHWGLLKKGVKTYRMAPMSPLNVTPTFFVCTSSLFHTRKFHLEPKILNKFDERIYPFKTTFVFGERATMDDNARYYHYVTVNLGHNLFISSV
jgi:hypothetical protein